MSDAVPEPARDGVHNVLTNLNAPVVFANDLLQGDIDRAGQTLGRFSVNSTLGLGGLIDVAVQDGHPLATTMISASRWAVGDAARARS